MYQSQTKPFTPGFIKYRLFYLSIWTYSLLQMGMSFKNQNRVANSVDSDEPSHLELHFLQRYGCKDEIIKTVRIICVQMEF